MMKKILLLTIFTVLVTLSGLSVQAQSPRSEEVRESRVVTDAYSLIAEVNALRASYGLAAYSVNPILMSVSQIHAEYMAATGTVTHYDGNGLRPFQRGLNAGYPLAGDISQGGFYSENIIAGNKMSVQNAVKGWQGDSPHLQTMLSNGLQEIGAGVALVGDYVYYVIDCASPTRSGQPQPYKTQQGAATELPLETVVYSPPLARTVIPNTPESDGKLYHIVGPGETLWLIAVSYGVKIVDIQKLNNMTASESIYPKEKLLVRAGSTPTPLGSTPTGTFEPTYTHIPTWTALPSLTPIPPTPVPVAPASSGASIWILGIIVAAALVLAGVFVRAGRSR
jgi:uncharacterized protein YkwD/LysM repeat protein